MKNKTIKLDYVLHFNPDNAKEAFEIIDWVLDRYKYLCHPAVSIEDSVTDDYIICLEDGKKLKSMKRYLRLNHDLTPAQYRAKWGLPHDYPMVAPSYSKRRTEIAKEIKLGQKT